MAHRVGTLQIIPPSDNCLPLISTGGKAPGTAELANIERLRGPSLRITSSPLFRSVATALKGITVSWI